jgi:hypothetical protein
VSERLSDNASLLCYSIDLGSLLGAFGHFNIICQCLEPLPTRVDHSNCNVARLARMNVADDATLACMSSFDDLTRVAILDFQIVF